MSRDWTQEELHTASEVMKQNGYMGFEEFCHALEQKQPVRFDFQERNRKELVNDISEILEEKAQYMKMPTCAYQIGNYNIAKDGTLTWDADTDSSDAELLLQKLAEKGWDMIFTLGTGSEEEPQPEQPCEEAMETESDATEDAAEKPDSWESAEPDGARGVSKKWLFKWVPGLISVPGGF